MVRVNELQVEEKQKLYLNKLNTLSYYEITALKRNKSCI